MPMKDSNEIKSSKERFDEKEGRKIYHSPHLKEYGSLNDLTQKKGGTKNDGNGVPATKH
jgi:hypothetical protein